MLQDINKNTEKQFNWEKALYVESLILAVHSLKKDQLDAIHRLLACQCIIPKAFS